MKKILVYTVLAALLLSSCDSYTGAGAYTGSAVGRVLGSAVGGITGGRHGHEIGTIVGMAGGAIIGGAIGSRADRRQQEQYEQYQQDRAQRRAAVRESPVDDVITFDAEEPGLVTISNVRFIDANRDNTISRGEVCRLEFEIYNTGAAPLYNIEPTVVETSGNSHIYISPTEVVRELAPNRPIRYIAIINADTRLKAGVANFSIAVMQGGRQLSNVIPLSVATRK